VTPFTVDLNEPVRVAKNNAFRDHWGSQPISTEAWEAWLSLPTLRRDLSRVAVTEDGSVAGFVVTSTNEDDWVAAGYSSAYIDLVGVTRAHRGTGIAPLLLADAIEAATLQGLERAVLDVDSVSPTGALGLYQRLGFIEESRSMNFVKVF
jgi:ribosomal protein S18 acetylase RimI-like enzyme